MSSLKSCSIMILPHANRKVLWGGQDIERSKIKTWIQHQKGTLDTELSMKTTYVACCDGVWEAQHEDLKHILDAENGERKVYFVKFKWLYDTLMAQKKVDVQPFLLEQASASGRRRGSKKTSTNIEDRDAVESFVDLLQASTKSHVDPRDEAKIKAAAEQDAAEREEIEAKARADKIREKEKETKRRIEYSRLVSRGALKAKNEQFGDDHHIYRDPDGFPYEVTLTKVEVLNNSNARVIFTIYESNAEPHTYALNMHSASTGTTPSNTILACVGTNQLTAKLMFCKAFKEKTLIDWDNRFEYFENPEYLQSTQDIEFSNRPYIYHIPAWGPTGRQPVSPQPNYVVVDAEFEGIVGRAAGNISMDLGHSSLGRRVDNEDVDMAVDPIAI